MTLSVPTNRFVRCPSSQDCTICLSKSRSAVAHLAGSVLHEFCGNCIRAWYDRGHSICPLCKRVVLLPPPNSIVFKKMIASLFFAGMSALLACMHWDISNRNARVSEYLSNGVNRWNSREYHIERDGLSIAQLSLAGVLFIYASSLGILAFCLCRGRS